MQKRTTPKRQYNRKKREDSQMESQAIDKQENTNNNETYKERLTRRKKQNIGGFRQKMAINNTLPGFILRWFNDQGSRIRDAFEEDWDFLSADDAKTLGMTACEIASSSLGKSGISMVVGSDERGHPLRAYCMKKREEWYEEDKAEKRDKREEVLDLIRKGESNVENSYTPSEGIKISR